MYHGAASTVYCVSFSSLIHWKDVILPLELLRPAIFSYQCYILLRQNNKQTMFKTAYCSCFCFFRSECFIEKKIILSIHKTD